MKFKREKFKHLAPLLRDEKKIQTKNFLPLVQIFQGFFFFSLLVSDKRKKNDYFCVLKCG